MRKSRRVKIYMMLIDICIVALVSVTAAIVMTYQQLQIIEEAEQQNDLDNQLLPQGSWL